MYKLFFTMNRRTLYNGGFIQRHLHHNHYLGEDHQGNPLDGVLNNFLLNGTILTATTTTGGLFSVDLATLPKDDDQLFQFDPTNGQWTVTQGSNNDQSGDLSQGVTMNTGTNILTIFGVPIDLSIYLDDTDEQTLSLVGSDLSISNGNTVTLPAGGLSGAKNGLSVNGSDVELYDKLGATGAADLLDDRELNQAGKSIDFLSAFQRFKNLSGDVRAEINGEDILKPVVSITGKGNDETTDSFFVENKDGEKSVAITDFGTLQINNGVEYGTRDGRNFHKSGVSLAPEYPYLKMAAIIGIGSQNVAEFHIETTRPMTDVYHGMRLYGSTTHGRPDNIGTFDLRVMCDPVNGNVWCEMGSTGNGTSVASSKYYPFDVSIYQSSNGFLTYKFDVTSTASAFGGFMGRGTYFVDLFCVSSEKELGRVNSAGRTAR